MLESIHTNPNEITKMIKTLTIVGLTLALTTTTMTYADGHNTGPLFYGQSTGFVADDPAAVVASMEKWRSSKSGKKSPTMVVLAQNIVNGEYKSTHNINVFYPNTEAMDQAATRSAGNKDWASFQAKLQRLIEPEWENTYAIMRAKANEGDVSSANPVSIIYALNVTDPATFMTAFDTLWNSPAVQKFPGAVYLGQNVASGNMVGTHFVTFVADTRGKLTAAVMAMQSSEGMSNYMDAAGDARDVSAINMSLEVKRWTNAN